MTLKRILHFTTV